MLCGIPRGKLTHHSSQGQAPGTWRKLVTSPVSKGRFGLSSISGNTRDQTRNQYETAKNSHQTVLAELRQQGGPLIDTEAGAMPQLLLSVPGGGGN